ncbi:MAG: glycosyltransferase [Candidatus Absconditabacteria bacterium]
MKGAYVHCRIAGGGALNVLKDLIQEDSHNHKYTEQPKIFTIYSAYKTLEIDGKIYQIITALPKFLNKLFSYCGEHHIKGISSLFDYRNLMPIYPLLMKILSRKIQKETLNYILISSFAVAKNIDQCKTKAENKKIKITLYLHSPMQYIRSHHEEYTGKLKGFKGRLFRKITNYLRNRDKQFTKYDTIRANSKYTADEGKKRYGFESTVKYPQLNPLFLEEQTITEADDYFVCVGRLVRFVREVDVIIKLFNTTKERLLVIGSGPDEIYLKSIAGNSIIFLGQMKSTEELLPILKKSRGLINLTKESFGLGTAEALCLGVPVFGYNQGATPELVDIDSGILVENKTLPHLIEKFEDFTNITRNKSHIQKYGKQKFH